MVAVNRSFGPLPDCSLHPEHVDSQSFMSRKLHAEFRRHPRHSLYHRFPPQWHHWYPLPLVQYLRFIPFWNRQIKCWRLMKRKEVEGRNKNVFGGSTFCLSLESLKDFHYKMDVPNNCMKSIKSTSFLFTIHQHLIWRFRKGIKRKYWTSGRGYQWCHWGGKRW